MDHISFPVTCYAKSFAFYEQLLGPLGFKPGKYFEKEGEYKVGSLVNAAGFSFWIASGPSDFATDASAQPALAEEGKRYGDLPGFHCCFAVDSVEAVNEWHARGLALGAKNNGDPGLRAHYHPHYYGAFLVDPFDGWRLEVCFHRAQL